jgi:hypothetical protein
MSKKLLTYFGIAAIGVYLFGEKKFKEAKTVMDNIKLELSSISNIKFNLPRIKFDAVLLLKNPTNIDFGATLSSKIIVKEIRIYSVSRQYLGKGNTNIFEIQLPPNSSVELPKLSLELEAETAIDDILSNLISYMDNALNSLVFEIDVQAFGNVFTINA